MAVDNGNSYKSGPAATAAPAHTEPVGLAVEEKLTVLLNKDGGMENMEVQGSMSLQARSAAPRASSLPASDAEAQLSSFCTSGLRPGPSWTLMKPACVHATAPSCA